MISKQRGGKTRMKRHCLFDAKPGWVSDVCVSDLVPKCKGFWFFSLHLIGTGRCIFSKLSTKPWVMLVLGAGEGSSKSKEGLERKKREKDLRKSHC